MESALALTLASHRGARILHAMDAMHLLETRASNPKLGEPAPDDATLDRVLLASLRAPDHGAVRPWKVFLVRGEDRNKLGDVLAECAAEAGGDAERARKKPLRAPLLIVVAATPCEHPKAPEIEQVLSAGALAQNILLGLHAEGFAAMWRTGPPAYATSVKRSLGLRAEDHIVAFIYAGTATKPAPEMPRPTLADCVVRAPFG